MKTTAPNLDIATERCNMLECYLFLKVVGASIGLAVLVAAIVLTIIDRLR